MHMFVFILLKFNMFFFLLVSVPLSVEGFKGDTVILPCLIKQKPVTVFWRFKETRTLCDINNGEADFDEQDSVFRNRVGIFPSEIPLGNFSIKLSSVNNTDEGLYTCSAPAEDYKQEVQLKVKDSTEKPGNGQNKSQVDGMIMFLLGCVLLYSFSF
ncbi:hypothetical protein HF521_014334 [Silurus meridionalis]|uniref:Ig-like domain-containing protein n=1 Tax=Silurus meridionalis TaxID=175797 RepID=A0A8T0ABG1_SILME|nr:hypothetical protein HF521_014334 [Silurus meridionalis]